MYNQVLDINLRREPGMAGMTGVRILLTTGTLIVALIVIHRHNG